MGTVAVPRPPRVTPRVPSGQLVLEPPPEPDRVVASGIVQKLLPVLMIAASVGFVAVLGPRNPTSWVFGGIFALSTIGMAVAGGGGRSANTRRADLDEDRRDYLRYLGVQRRRIREVAAAQRAALEHVHPDPVGWPAVLAAGRLWERRPDDPDFGELRLGRGPQRLAVELVAPRTGPVDGLEPVTALALRRFLLRNSVVADLPVALSLRGSATVWLDGEPGAVRALARALIAQYVLWHGPDDASLAVLAAPQVLGEWDWAKWLPHAAHPARDDAIGSVRMITSDVDDVRRWWVGEPVGHRHLLLVVDGVADGPGPWAAVPGISVLRVGAPAGRRPAASVVRLTIHPDRLERRSGDRPAAVLGRPDAVAVAEAQALARRLARFRPAGAMEKAAPVVRSATGLPELLNLDISPSGVTALRAGRGPADRLRVPVGVDEHGAPVLLDLKESAQGGSGPHGLCIGATGSGKSELLRTLVLGLVAAHPSDALNLVLVDFKGGATFLGLSGLPHVSAVITNLADELTLVDRMADALAGEITRRQELLRAAGNLTGVAEYAAERAKRPDLPPLPALLVVVDEFSELLAQRPEMIDLLVTIGRLGRSLGLHLLLASQRLEEGRLRGLESHLSYRIALRTFSAAESRAVLGVPDAHQLPSTPGAAFLSTGTDELVRFRAAYVSGPVAGAAAPRTRAGRPLVAHLFTAGPVVAPPAPEVPDAAPTQAPSEVTVLDTMTSAMVGQGPPAHQVWLPPLADPPALDTLPPAPPGALRAVAGEIDRPYLQRRDPLVLDLGGAAGHLAIVGGPRSGKSTALAGAILALAAGHTPAELGVHVLDLGGGVLRSLAGLPHVGTVADRQQPDLVRRVIAEVAATVDRRERLFRDAGIASVEQFRARRAELAAGRGTGVVPLGGAGGRPVDAELRAEPCTDLLLVVDGYPTLRSDFDELEARLLPLAARGLAYGVHLVLSSNRWTDLRPALKDLLGSRWELRLGEPAESEVDRRRAVDVPARAGHGLSADGAPMVLAAPRTTELDTAGLVAHLAAKWAGPGMEPVRLLPTLIAADALPAGTGGIVIGLDEEGLQPVEIDLAAEPHLVCFADSESGKTNVLRLIARGITRSYSPEEARVVVFDYRRGLLGVVPDSHLIGYASTADAATASARDIADSLRRRLPGPDVTPRELRERSWWSGPDVYLLVDDYDLVAPGGAGGANPLLPLVEFLAQAKDVGLHLVVARRSGGAGRAQFDPLLGRLRELATPGLVMSGSPDEGALVESVKPMPQPPGRGTLVDRRRGARLVQVAWLDPDAGTS